MQFFCNVSCSKKKKNHEFYETDMYSMTKMKAVWS